MAKITKKLKVLGNNTIDTTVKTVEVTMNVVNSTVELINPVADIINSSVNILQSEANIINKMVEEKINQRLSDNIEAKLRLLMGSMTLASIIQAIKSLTDADINAVKAKDLTLAKRLTMAKAVVKTYEKAIKTISTDDLSKAMEDIAKLEEGLSESFSTLQLGIKGLIGL